ncbi:MAG TPA: DNA-processing protein DprA, partial [Bacteroidales bacterium]|nr:DNA-processing protein DprA [Bacteroidales bacterium]
FLDPSRHLKKYPRIREFLAGAVAGRDILARAGEEVAFLEKFRIKSLFFRDRDYPHRLKNCHDAPVMLYYKGVADLNAPRVIGIVGTRNATAYGKDVTRKFVEDLVDYNVLVVSGLAYGIDGCAHRQAVASGLATVGVLGHGLDTIYPWAHKPLAEKMVTQGGLLTEFLSRTKPDRNNFPMRNRIIAGLCDAVVVVEAGVTGGALITAEIANTYNRDVFAVPGRVTDPVSEGTNTLIRTNRAALIQKAGDIAYLMGWNDEGKPVFAPQKKIFIELTREEERIVELLRPEGTLGIDELSVRLDIPMSRVSASLLNLEFEGVVKCLPGKRYSLL